MSETLFEKWKRRIADAWAVLVGRLIACDPANFDCVIGRVVTEPVPECKQKPDPFRCDYCGVLRTTTGPHP